MALARQKTWSFEEVLASSDLNTEFDNLVDNGHLNDEGERVVCQKNTAPTGWTKDTTTSGLNDTALRFTTGTVGSSTGGLAFTTVFTANYASDPTTLSTSQMPTHNHVVPGANATGGSGATTSNDATTNTNPLNTDNAGSSNSHTHTVDLNVDYFDVIVIEKDAN